ncbi:MAG: tRNA (guanine(46)-N(7))-methyltransferase TrmB [Granulosicoccaceae bacterium]
MVSNQRGPHDNLIKAVKKHQSNSFAKPVAEHSHLAFEKAQSWLKARAGAPLIFDSCCGVGQSSRIIAERYPDHSVIAVDKSEHRLQRATAHNIPNLLLLRADLNDFYRLAQQSQWRLTKHFILYPNPWPKSAHLGRRWHAAPVFPYMLALAGELEIRSNWKLYIDEFQLALGCYGIASTSGLLQADEPLTPFEAKYTDSGQSLWQLTANVPTVHCAALALCQRWSGASQSSSS